MTRLLLFFLTFTSLNVQATVAENYLLFLKDQTQSAQAWQKQLKAKSSAVCPKSTDKSWSSCFKEFIKTQQIKSSTQLALFYVMATSAALKDKGKGTGTEGVLVLFDNLLTVMEKANLHQFYLSQYQATLEEEKILAKLKSDDEKILAKSQVRIRGIIDKNMKKALETASYSQKIKLQKFQKRLDAASDKKWTYPDVMVDNETVPAMAAPIHVSNQDISSLCGKDTFKECFTYDYNECFQKVLKFTKTCRDKNPRQSKVELNKCVLGIWVRSARVTGKMKLSEECKTQFPPEY